MDRLLNNASFAGNSSDRNAGNTYDCAANCGRLADVGQVVPSTCEWTGYCPFGASKAHWESNYNGNQITGFRVVITSASSRVEGVTKLIDQCKSENREELFQKIDQKGNIVPFENPLDMCPAKL